MSEELNRVGLAADRLARAEQRVEKTREELYAAIREARAAGASVRLIARVAKLSPARVSQILKR